MQNLTRPYSITLLPLSNPSMHAIVWCNMGLANHPKRKFASCIHPSPYLLQAFKYLLKMKPKPPPWPPQQSHHPLVEFHYSSTLLSLSPSVWREKERSNVIKFCPSIKKKVLQPHPSPLLEQATSWTPPTLSTIPLTQPETTKLPHIAPNRPTHFSSGYKASEHHSSSQTPHYTPATLPSHPADLLCCLLLWNREGKEKASSRSARKKTTPCPLWILSALHFCMPALHSSVST
jgi:hypothetical protein